MNDFKDYGKKITVRYDLVSKAILKGENLERIEEEGN